MSTSTRKAVPDWPGDHVRVLSALEMARLVDGGGTDGVAGAIKFAALCGIDAEGGRLWADEAEAGAADWRRVRDVAMAGMRFNGLLEEDDASGN